MSSYQIITIIINSILALTSIISCVSSFKAKKDVISVKDEINTMIYGFESKNNISTTKACNSGMNNGAVAGNISGGVSISNGK